MLQRYRPQEQRGMADSLLICRLPSYLMYTFKQYTRKQMRVNVYGLY
jgi:hypothetical protein